MSAFVQASPLPARYSLSASGRKQIAPSSRMYPWTTGRLRSLPRADPVSWLSVSCGKAARRPRGPVLERLQHALAQRRRRSTQRVVRLAAAALKRFLHRLSTGLAHAQVGRQVLGQHHRGEVVGDASVEGVPAAPRNLLQLAPVLLQPLTSVQLAASGRRLCPQRAAATPCPARPRGRCNGHGSRPRPRRRARRSP
jgi:hypothetical protein